MKRDSDSSRTAASPPVQRQPRVRKGIKSLAVLPLVNTSGDPDCEYLSEGIAESLIGTFSQLPKLRLAPQQKCFRYRGAEVDLQQAAAELNVQAILNGRILLRGDTLVVKMGLVDAEMDAQVWAQQYTKKLSDIFTLQDEIADEVLEALKLKLAGAPKKRVARQTHDIDAYHLYLKGRYYCAKRTSPNIKKAVELFEQAIDKDPNYALAYAGLADCYFFLGFTPYGTMRPSEAFPRAKTAAEKALLLDGSLGEAYASLGACALYYDWDWQASERAFCRSLELAPDNVSAANLYPILLAVIGRFEESVQEARRLFEIDPLSSNSAANVALALFFARRHDEAMTAASKAIDIDPAFPSSYAYMAFALQAKGQFAEAVRYYEKVVSIFPHHLQIGYLGGLYGLAGRHADAARIHGELTELSNHTYVSPMSFAILYQGIGDVEHWRKMMQAGFEERAGVLAYLKCAPWYDPMRSDPFFRELERKVGSAKA